MNHFIHAVYPLLGLHPEHPVNECVYCRDNKRIAGGNIDPAVPLYCQNVSSSHNITRYSITISTVQDVSYPINVSNIFKQHFRTKINRILTHSIIHIGVSQSSINKELKSLIKLVKPHNHLMFYTNVHIPDLIKLLIEFNHHSHIWGILDYVEHAEEYIKCNYSYSYSHKPESKGIVTKTYRNIDYSPTNIYLFSSKDPSLWDIINKILIVKRHRVTLYTLLKEVSFLVPSVKLITNKPFNTENIFLGFG